MFLSYSFFSSFCENATPYNQSISLNIVSATTLPFFGYFGHLLFLSSFFPWALSIPSLFHFFSFVFLHYLDLHLLSGLLLI